MTTNEGALRRLARCRLGRRRGQVLRLVKNEIIELLGPEAGEFFARQYDVTDEGNFEGHNILNRLKSVPRTRPTKRARLCATMLLGAR